ncbi:glycosyltransferase 87 family protein [Geobacter sp. SVR]|uniref:glycosyltransferase 87 family protein n=1 Tax=Geobacter sp. SVR TaxID=2495594 RepID=UPI00143EF91E|nr:glycosyltransferase 87 family protein [Geobacter sp. SVR]BCS53230.1 hypothetical protein GSVR_15380 [Geobacter sp. SVR]GCF84615.1 hypothetical protein GSbR_12150 [Geobacter sp. SVR]
MSALVAVVVVAACGLLATVPELRLAVPLLVGTTAVMVMVLAFLLYRGERGTLAWPPVMILGIALLLRLMFVFSPPQLSDDLYRYLWDGGNLLRGINPYAAAPAVVRPPPELAATHALVNHPQYVTIYPPAAQVVFAAGAACGGSLLGIKSLLVTLDLGLCALMMVLLRRLDLPVWRSALYAWNPLPVLEIAGSGHIDGAGLTMAMGAFCLIFGNRDRASGSRWRPLLAGALLAAAGLVKLFPFLLAPIAFMLLAKRERALFAAGFGTALAALVLSFMPHLANGLATLEVYARNWEFAGFGFNLLRRTTGSGTTARLLLSGCLLLIGVALYGRLLRILQRERDAITARRRAIETCYGIALALLLLTPTLQPWYALCLAAFLPFCAGPAGLVLCWTVFLTYQVQIPYFILGEWIENPVVTAAVFAAPVTAGVLGRMIGGAGGISAGRMKAGCVSPPS